jgi:hypothetical protein
MKTHVHLITSLRILLNIRNVSGNLFIYRKSSHTFYFQQHFYEDFSVYETIRITFCTPGRAADDNTIGHMRFSCWIKWIQTHTLRIRNTYFLFFLGNNFYVNTLNCYLIYSLPVLLTLLCTVHIALTSSSSSSVLRLNIFFFHFRDRSVYYSDESTFSAASADTFCI